MSRSLNTTSRKSLASSLLKIALTAGTLAALVYFVNWNEITAAVSRISLSAATIMLVMAGPVHFFQFQRWNMLAKRAGDNVSTSDIHRGYWVGFTLGLMTPGRVGQFGRALMLKGCSAARALGLTVIERFYAAVVINGFGLIALAVLPSLEWKPAVGGLSDWLRIVCLLTGIAIVAVGLFPFILKRPFLAITSRLPLSHKTSEAVHTLDSVKSADSAVLLGLAITSLLFTLIQYVICLRAMGTDLPWLAGILAALLTLFLKGMLPFTMGSLGIGEWSAMICFQGLGVPAADAVATSLIVFSMNVLIPSLIGAPFLSHLRLPSFQLVRTEPDSA